MLPKRFHYHHTRLPLCESGKPLLGWWSGQDQSTDAAFIIQVSHILHLWSEPLGSLEYTLGNPSPEVLGSCHFIHPEKTCL